MATGPLDYLRTSVKRNVSWIYNTPNKYPRENKVPRGPLFDPKDNPRPNWIHSTPWTRHTAVSDSPLYELESALGIDLSHIPDEGERLSDISGCEFFSDTGSNPGLSLSELSDSQLFLNSSHHISHRYPLELNAAFVPQGAYSDTLRSIATYKGSVSFTPTPKTCVADYCPGPDSLDLVSTVRHTPTMSNTSAPNQVQGAPGGLDRPNTDNTRPNKPEDDQFLQVMRVNFALILQEALKDKNIQTLYQTMFQPLLEPMVTKIKTLEQKIATLAHVNTCQEDSIEALEYKLDSQEQRNRKFNLKISGIPENPGENPAVLIEQIASVLHANVTRNDFEACYRIGGSRPGKPRAILVKFNTIDAKIRLFSARKSLKEHKSTAIKEIFVNEDLAPIRSKMLFIARNLKNANLIFKYWVYDSEVFIRKTENSEPEKLTGQKPIRVLSSNVTCQAIIESANKPLPNKPFKQRIPRGSTQQAPQAYGDGYQNQANRPTMNYAQAVEGMENQGQGVNMYTNTAPQGGNGFPINQGACAYPNQAINNPFYYQAQYPPPMRYPTPNQG